MHCTFSSSPSKVAMMSILFGVFIHFLLKFKHFDEFFPFQIVIANLCVCCVHPLNKDISQAQFKNQSACIKTVYIADPVGF